MDRIVTKSNLHDHLKLKKGKPGGTLYGTFTEFEKETKRSKSTIAAPSNKKFLKPTPSIKDMEIRKLIGKYPV